MCLSDESKFYSINLVTEIIDCNSLMQTNISLRRLNPQLTWKLDSAASSHKKSEILYELKNWNDQMKALQVSLTKTHHFKYRVTVTKCYDWYECAFNDISDEIWNIEQLWITVTINCRAYCFGVVYRPLNLNHKFFVDPTESIHLLPLNDDWLFQSTL